MFVGGIGDGIAAILILAGLGAVFIAGAIIAVFLKIIGVGSGRAVLWGFGVPLAGFVVMGILAVMNVSALATEAEAISIPRPPEGFDDVRQ
jgi:hypothetical protein